MSLEKKIIDVLNDVGTPLTYAALCERCYEADAPIGNDDDIPQSLKDDVRRELDSLFCQVRIVKIYVFFNGANREKHTFYTTKKLAEELEENW